MKNLSIVAKIFVALLVIVIVFTFNNVIENMYMLNPIISLWPYIILSLILIKYTVMQSETSETENINKYRNVKVSLTVIIICVIINIFSLKYFQAEKLGNILIANVDIELSDLIDSTDKRNVTLAMAIQKAGKVMSSEVNGVQLSSQYELDVDNASIQLLNDKLVWILPVDHKSLFSWLKQVTAPGYIIVSASDPISEAKLINDRKMKYTSNAYYLENIKLINTFTSFLGIIKTHLEVNEEGEPYYVAINIKPKGFFNGYVTSSIQLINAETGERTGFIDITDFLKMNKYKWVDILTNEEEVKDLMNFKSLVNGSFNYLIIGENIVKTTSYSNSELWVIKTKQGLKWFSGMTSTSTKDNSMISAFYVDTRDNESLVKINTSGIITENEAAIAVEGKLGTDSVKWSPVLPTLIEINGELFWDMIVTNDSNGLFQKYARVNAKNQTLVTISNTQDIKEILKKKLKKK